MPLKIVYPFLLIILFAVNSFSQADFKLIAPRNGTTISNNMPNLSWQKTDCQHYEIWMDGIRMDRIPSSQNAYIPFPLSFGKHTWKVVAIGPKGKKQSNSHELIINDAALSDVPAGSFLLREGWKVKSSADVGLNGKQLSVAGVNTKNWANTSIPATVLTALVRNGIYPNPYIGTNNMLIPDISDEYNKQYDLLKYSHIKNKNPWKQPYWFRNEFVVPENFSGKHIWLNFGEINYKAQVWLNGKLVADTSEMIGMERSFRFDINSELKKGTKNVLAVAIWPPNHPGKPAIEPLTPLSDPGQNMGDGQISRDYTKWDTMGWDWQPAIRDRNMGITEDVFLSATDDIELDNVYVTSNLNLPDTTTAEITISANLVNHSVSVQEGVVKIVVKNGSDEIAFEEAYKIAPNSVKEFIWDKSTVKSLRIQNAKLWWPFGYGKQNLYTVSLTATTKTNDFATATETFGIRKVETYIGAKERVYKINGREIYPKGGNWVVDMMLNWNASRYEKEILLTRNANLNMLRVWGPTGVAPKALYEAADKYGILMWQDFLNDFWGTFKNTPGFQPEISLYEKATTGIVKKLRNHPSLVIWCGGNEGMNPREELILSILKKYDGRDTRHFLKQSDGDGLHGGGPYHTLEPKDYFTHPKLNGFSSEIGPSGIPPMQSMEKFMPEMGKSWAPGRFPLDGIWAYHDANNWPGNDTRKFTSYDNMLRHYYGAPDTTTALKGVENYLEKCQLINYDVYRASIESINRQLWSNASGILLWKSNSSWPSITWQVYDWYLQANAGFYGAKKAANAVHIQFNRDDQSISFLNLLSKPMNDISISATLYDLKMKQTWSANEKISTGGNCTFLTGITVPENREVQFLKLIARNTSGEILAENFYWLNQANNFRALNELPEPKLEVSAKLLSSESTHNYKVTLKNSGNSLAFMVNLKLVGKDSKQEILPAFWSDNFLCLLPGETKTLEVEIMNDDLVEVPVLEYSTFGSKKENLEIK
ncbi:MAG: beta galactosidase jelly roll domain-containing protein [Prolixibacteraceae bacterium]|nr:beta galactosidase jelly roll domain-containing protein [Prolixibacteraceae bacterium]